MQVFILTRQWQQTAEGLTLTYWGTTGEQAVKVVMTQQRSICFVQSNQPLKFPLKGIVSQRKSLELKTLTNQPVDGLYFSNQYDLRHFAEQAWQNGIQLFESDVKPTDRFLMERFITAACEVEGDLDESSAKVLSFTNPSVKPTDFKPKLKWLSLDIETDENAEQLYSIAVLTEQSHHVFILGSIDSLKTDEINHSLHETETEMIKAFLLWITQYDPDVLIGWNIVGFDLIVLERKCQQLGIQFTLGREQAQARIFKSTQAGEMNIAQIAGRVVMDGIEMLRAAFWSFESFALDFVAQELLGKSKLIGDENKTQKITDLFEHDKLKLAQYNLEDCRLVAQIFEHTGLIDFAIERSVMTGLAFGRVGGSVAAFDNLYLPRLHRKGFVAPNVGAQTDQTPSPGGYVMDSLPGLYDNVLVLDFKSLYPSIIRTFKIDPLGLMQPGDDPIEGFLNARFARDDNILPELIAQLWDKRDQAKALENAPLSQAIKIIMNSFYGVLGTNACRFFDPRLASSITRRGHEIIQNSKQFIEQQGRQVIYGDTDSIFVLLEAGLGRSQALKIGNEMMVQLNQYWREKIAAEYDLSSYLEVEFETHFSKFYMPTVRGSDQGSKKRYAGWVLNDQGRPKLIVKGLEAVRTDWTEFARNAQMQILTRVFSDQPIAQVVLNLAEDLTAGVYDQQLVYRKRLRKPLSSYTKNVPPHVQAARKLANPSRHIDYVITLNGAEPVSELTAQIDYQHYLERQLKPALAGIMSFVDLDFDEVVGAQLSLF